MTFSFNSFEPAAKLNYGTEKLRPGGPQPFRLWETEMFSVCQCIWVALTAASYKLEFADA